MAARPRLKTKVKKKNGPCPIILALQEVVLFKFRNQSRGISRDTCLSSACLQIEKT